MIIIIHTTIPTTIPMLLLSTKSNTPQEYQRKNKESKEYTYFFHSIAR